MCVYVSPTRLGTKFWKFDPAQKPPVTSAYPKPISNWDGIPDNLDAALHYTNGYTYFFKDGNYYRFNDRTFAVSVVPLSARYYCLVSRLKDPVWFSSGRHRGPAVSQERRLLVVRLQGREQGQPQRQRRTGGGQRGQTDVVGSETGPQGQSKHRRRRPDNGRR